MSAPCEANLSYERAHNLMRVHARPLDPETIPIAEAAGRVLAEPLSARVDSPRADVAAMDGFAVREDTLTPGLGNLAIAGTTYAGELPGMPLDRHLAWRITTGAPVPANADRVIPFELVEERAECISLAEPLPMGRHIRKRATDFRTGQILLDAGTLLDPARLIVATASDQPFAVVHRRPRLRIVASGDELSPAGEAAARTMGVPDSLTDALLLFARLWGAETDGKAIVGDEAGAIEQATRFAIERADIVVVLGGAASGDRDLSRPALLALGLELDFAGVAMKPGKPVWYGRIGRTHVLGLPGNPAGALIAARLFLAPLLSALGGRGFDAAFAWREAKLEHAVPAGGSKELFLYARQEYSAVRIIDKQSASAQLPLAAANLIARRQANAPALLEGDTITVLDL